REKLEGAERRIEELTKCLQTDTQQHEQCASEREDLMVGRDTLQNDVRQMEELQGQLNKQEQHLQQTAQELEQLCKDAQQSSLMDMELADYERLVEELNIQISEKDTQIEDLKKQLLTQKNKVLEGAAQYLLENGLTKLVHSGFTPHKKEVQLAWTNALSHAPDVGISCVVLLLAWLTILSPLR